MKHIINGVVTEMSDDEVKYYKKEQMIYENQQKRSSLSESEVFKILAKQQVNTLSIPDETSLRMKEYYPTFEESVGKQVESGYKFTYKDRLYKVIQPSLTIQDIYPPGTGTESLYTEINETYAGTFEEPIPYNNNMELEEGKYYFQDNELYKCTRNTEIPVYQPLADLVGIYVEIA